MPNEGGTNQFGNYTIQPGYGDVKKQTELTKEAPLSGSPIAAQALNTPRRGQRRVARGKQQQPVAPLPAPQPAPQATAAQAWQQIATIPGASPLVQQYAAEAQQWGT